MIIEIQYKVHACLRLPLSPRLTISWSPSFNHPIQWDPQAISPTLHTLLEPSSPCSLLRCFATLAHVLAAGLVHVLPAGPVHVLPACLVSVFSPDHRSVVPASLSWAHGLCPSSCVASVEHLRVVACVHDVRSSPEFWMKELCVL